MKKILIYLFSGTYFFGAKLNKVFFSLAFPVAKWFYIVMYHVFPFLKNGLKKKGLTMNQYIENSYILFKKIDGKDISGLLQRSVERYITYVLFLFFAEIVCILRRLLNIDVLNKLIYNYKFAVLLVCILMASFCVTKIENFVMKGKKLTTLDRKPKDFRYTALFVFFASCLIVVFVFLKLWW